MLQPGDSFTCTLSKFMHGCWWNLHQLTNFQFSCSHGSYKYATTRSHPRSPNLLRKSDRLTPPSRRLPCTRCHVGLWQGKGCRCRRAPVRGLPEVVSRSRNEAMRKVQDSAVLFGGVSDRVHTGAHTDTFVPQQRASPRMVVLVQAHPKCAVQAEARAPRTVLGLRADPNGNTEGMLIIIFLCWLVPSSRTAASCTLMVELAYRCLSRYPSMFILQVIYLLNADILLSVMWLMSTVEL